jgi:hypothetical protein
MTQLTTTTVQHQDALTPEMFSAALPEKMRKNISQKLINEVNNILSDPDEYEAYRDNLISYTSVMQDGKYKIESYLDAVRYVTFKLMGHTDKDAFMKTFPVKWQRWIAQGMLSKDMASYVTAYHKGKLVNAIMAQTLVPTYVLNADLHQKALNVQAELMLDPNVSPKVRSDAANSLLTHLKAPETQKIELNVGTNVNDEIKQMSKVMIELAAAQKLAIQSGQMRAQEVAHSKIIEAETVETRDV